MQYALLGNSTLNISRLSLGTLCVDASVEVQKKVESVFISAIEKGVNIIDTSANYYNGASEIFAGKILKKVSQKNVFIATKCFFPVQGKPKINGLSSRSIIASVEFSLKNLGVDCIDLLQCHRWDPEIEIEETAATMNQLHKQGKIKYWGLGNASISQLVETAVKCEKNALQKPISHQHVYNMFNRTIEADSANVSKLLGMGVLIYSPLAQGVLSGKYSGNTIPQNSRAYFTENRKTMWEFTQEKILKAGKISDLALGFNYNPSALALAWALRNENITSLIMGVNTIEQLEQNLDAFNIEITHEMELEIEKILNNKPKNQYIN